MTQCSFCQEKREHLLTCSACMDTQYCGYVCQVRHWKQVHRKQCIAKRSHDTEHREAPPKKSTSLATLRAQQAARFRKAKESSQKETQAPPKQLSKNTREFLAHIQNRNKENKEGKGAFGKPYQAYNAR